MSEHICSGTIGDGFIVCGEGENYCSEICHLRATLTWRDVFNCKSLNYGNLIESMKLALSAGYNYMAWNDCIYKIKENECFGLKLHSSDLDIHKKQSENIDNPLYQGRLSIANQVYKNKIKDQESTISKLLEVENYWRDSFNELTKKLNNCKELLDLNIKDKLKIEHERDKLKEYIEKESAARRNAEYHLRIQKDLDKRNAETTQKLNEALANIEKWKQTASEEQQDCNHMAMILGMERFVREQSDIKFVNERMAHFGSILALVGQLNYIDTQSSEWLSLYDIKEFRKLIIPLDNYYNLK